MDDWTDSGSGLAVRVAELEADNRSLRDRAAELEAALTEARHMVESHRRDALVLASLDEAIVVTDREGIVTYWNAGATKIFGWTTAERVGRPIFEMYSDPAARARAAARFRSVLAGEDCAGEMQDFRKDGRPILLFCHARRYLGPSGEPAGVLRVAHDITELKRIDQQLQQTQKLESIGVLAGGIAHDFNNLLTVIIGNAALLEPSLPPQSPERNSAEQIMEAGRRAADLCAHLLVYAGKGRFSAERLDLNRLIRNNEGQLRSLNPGKTELRLELANVLPAIEGDATQLQQALTSLVTNSVEAMEGRDGGAVWVRTGTILADRALLAGYQVEGELPEGEYVLLQVSDNGCGMAPEVAPRIFDPFFTTKFAGRGLGLAAVLGIVRSHRGGIGVETALHAGTTMRLIFPVAPTTTEAQPVKPIALGLLLVIEDEDAIRELDRMVFEQVGFRVLTARDGAQGLELFRRHVADIQGVLLDLTMPGMSGRETATEMHAIRQDVPIVLTSGFTGDEALAIAGPGNITAFLQKPYAPAQLLATMQRVLGTSKG